MHMSSPFCRRVAAIAIATAVLVGFRPAQGADKRIVLIAGRPSHPPGMHEFRAGCLLFQKALASVPGLKVDVYDMGWPSKTVDGGRVDDNTAFENADAVLIYADGGKNHPAIQGDRLNVIEGLAARGVGIAFAHYGVEVPAGAPGGAWHRLIGGYYETLFSVNPMWTPKFDKLPDHPVTRGVRPFATHDEWYYNMRWPSDEAVKKRITHILVDTPSDADPRYRTLVRLLKRWRNHQKLDGLRSFTIELMLAYLQDRDGPASPRE